ncbi:hypothetical protein [Butyrivibrio proteoclasticus]|uniref:hypothetical protein n=1 Tax=Butyrivibrio proteoclasticus TaxID=43305 RepID=UPI00047886A1|nr:hypothetical protein [Butyrivibrio proteoclasticus]
MNTAMKDAELEKVSGGSLYLDGMKKHCLHERKCRTGGERDVTRWIFWDAHEYQYFCPDCKEMFWD